MGAVRTTAEPAPSFRQVGYLAAFGRRPLQGHAHQKRRHDVVAHLMAFGICFARAAPAVLRTPDRMAKALSSLRRYAPFTALFAVNRPDLPLLHHLHAPGKYGLVWRVLEKILKQHCSITKLPYKHTKCKHAMGCWAEDATEFVVSVTFVRGAGSSYGCVPKPVLAKLSTRRPCGM